MRIFSCLLLSGLDFTSKVVCKMFLGENVFNEYSQKSAV